MDTADRSFDGATTGASAAAVPPAPQTAAPARRPGGAGGRPLRVGFVMEQVLGHVTWYQNLRRGVEALGEIEARWIETDMFDRHGLLERTPGVPDFVRASARARIDMRRGLRDWPCDVLVFNTQKAAAFCQWEMLRTPTMLMTDVTPVQYDRMAAGYEHATDGNPLVRAAKHQVNVINFRLAHALLPWSSWVGESFVEDYGVPRERVHVVPVGLDVDAWQPPLVRPTNDRVRLLFVGGHLARKGGDLLLRVFRERRLHERADLHLVTRDAAVQPGPGVFVHRNMRNNSDALRALYQSADVFVLPTLADCFSIASLEAMAVGLPVVTTTIGGIPDIVADGETGYLLRPGHGRGLSDALCRLVDDASLRAAMGAAGRRRLVERFNARTNAARVIHLAHDVHAAAGRKRSAGR